MEDFEGGEMTMLPDAIENLSFSNELDTPVALPDPIHALNLYSNNLPFSSPCMDTSNFENSQCMDTPNLENSLAFDCIAKSMENDPFISGIELEVCSSELGQSPKRTKPVSLLKHNWTEPEYFNKKIKKRGRPPKLDGVFPVSVTPKRIGRPRKLRPVSMFANNSSSPVPIAVLPNQSRRSYEKGKTFPLKPKPNNQKMVSILPKPLDALTVNSNTVTLPNTGNRGPVNIKFVNPDQERKRASISPITDKVDKPQTGSSRFQASTGKNFSRTVPKVGMPIHIKQLKPTVRKGRQPLGVPLLSPNVQYFYGKPFSAPSGHSKQVEFVPSMPDHSPISPPVIISPRSVQQEPNTELVIKVDKPVSTFLSCSVREDILTFYRILS